MAQKNESSRTMPHVVVKLWPGKSEQLSKKLAGEISQSVMSVFSYGDGSVSVAFEKVESQQWTEKAHRPDIKAKRDQLGQENGIEPARKGRNWL
jgi:4-oxalocrotonate tautomerase